MKIDIKQLRIGNYLLYGDEPCEVKSISKYSDKIEISSIEGISKSNYTSDVQIDSLEYILVTKEWLEKAGYKYYNNTYYRFLAQGNIQQFNIFISLENKMLIIDDASTRLDAPEYLHQFQNLHFALTGKELIF